MKDEFVILLDYLRENHSLILMTIVRREGSAPRNVGARMWLVDNEEVGGTIGGGKIEYLALQTAKKLLKSKKSQVVSYHLGNEEAAQIGMVCGGTILLSYQYLSKDIEGQVEVLQKIVDDRRERKNIWLTMKMGKTSGYTIDIAYRGEKQPTCIEEDEYMYYTEPLRKVGVAYIFGGGHVSTELAPLLVRLGFSCVVYDDREEFANKKRFPDATRIICAGLEDIDKFIELSAEDYVISMTRGHMYDLAVQSWALKNKPRYIGIIGSRKKIAFVTKELLKLGFSLEEIESCHTPIGLDIGAETPEEIAVSIAAELILVRSTG